MAENTAVEKSNLQDLLFGTQLLGDYARFILNALHVQDTAEISEAQRFIALFDDLYAKRVQNTPLEQINQEIFKEVQNFRKYILQILRQQILEKITISLNPNVLNMMVNTTELLLDGLNSYMHHKYPDTSTLTSLWLQDIYTTTLMLQDKLGILYFEERAKAAVFANIFLNLYNKSLIIDGFRRTGLNDFPALTQFHNQIQKNMIAYAEYLVDLFNLLTKKEYTGMLTLLDVDSMYRRACFFMTKLSAISKITAPVCNPATPRNK